VSATRRISMRVCAAFVISDTLCALAYRTSTRRTLNFLTLILDSTRRCRTIL
jgi:hypothetical protein